MKIYKKNKIKENFWKKEELDLILYKPDFVLAACLPTLYKKYEEMSN